MQNIQTLKNETKEKELNGLKKVAQEAALRMNRVQDQILTISQNIQHNQKLIVALENENKELEERSNSVTVSSTGVVDFSEFDKYSDDIIKNKRKIEKLREVISTFEKEKEYILLTSFADVEKACNLAFLELYTFVGNALIAEIISENIDKLNKAYSLVSILDATMSKDYFTAFISKTINEHLEYSKDSIESVEKYPIFKFRSPKNQVGNRWRSENRIAELKKELNKTE